jgi:hypothetical protein
LTSVIIFDKLPPSELLPLGLAGMNKAFFLFAAMDGNLEQIARLVDSGKLKSGL